EREPKATTALRALLRPGPSVPSLLARSGRPSEREGPSGSGQISVASLEAVVLGVEILIADVIVRVVIDPRRIIAGVVRVRVGCGGLCVVRAWLIAIKIIHDGLTERRLHRVTRKDVSRVLTEHRLDALEEQLTTHDAGRGCGGGLQESR